ncbi:MAG TPA: SIMPL domain-containing protein [Bdellovibrionales bacterium]|nr:SIMPL domain-containing protein [Bdellovibrionales bacterium]
MKAVLLAISVLISSTQAFALDRIISTSGTCTKSVVPDRGSITVVANVQDMDLNKASKRATEAYEKMKAAVQKLGLKDVEIKTTEYDLSEVREWEKERSVFKGFRARMGLGVETSEINRLGEVIALAAKQGLREVGQLQTFMSDKKSAEERESCLEDAIGNARSKASRMAKAANGKVGKVIAMVESGTMMPPPVLRMAKAEMMAADAPAGASVDPGTQKLAVSVDVTFSLE